MKFYTLTAALNKRGFKIVQSSFNKNLYRVHSKTKFGTFHKQGDDVVCVCTCFDTGEKSDIRSDYFVENYHKTIKSFLDNLGEPANE
jgi:hypothetical protein